MAPDLSEKLLGIDIGDEQDRTRHAGDDEDQEERERFVFFEAGSHRFALPVDAVRTLAEIPDELTRVPRAPAAIEGMVDLRGEVTAVIDPCVHFSSGDTETTPAPESDPFDDTERLLVLDRPGDQQSAALRADEVLGVETIPESDILDESAVEDGPLSGDALEHPLVAALIRQERTPEQSIGSVVSSSPVSVDAAAEPNGGLAAGATALSARDASPNESEREDGATFDLVEETTPPANDDSDPATASEPREIIVEVTPLIAVDDLLLASGRESQDR